MLFQEARALGWPAETDLDDTFTEHAQQLCSSDGRATEAGAALLEATRQHCRRKHQLAKQRERAALVLGSLVLGVPVAALAGSAVQAWLGLVVLVAAAAAGARAARRTPKADREDARRRAYFQQAWAGVSRWAQMTPGQRLRARRKAQMLRAAGKAVGTVAAGAFSLVMTVSGLPGAGSSWP